MLSVFLFVFLVIFCAKMNFQDLPDVFPLRLCDISLPLSVAPVAPWRETLPFSPRPPRLRVKFFGKRKGFDPLQAPFLKVLDESF